MRDGGRSSRTVFDIGMFDASDTQYYLDLDFNVVAVEANPILIEEAATRFGAALAEGRLVLVNAAVTEVSGLQVTLTVARDDPGSSSIFEERVASRRPGARFTVASVTIGELFESYGTPFYLKVDIEGADRFAILPLESLDKPTYLSFEAGADADELVGHLVSIGFTRFKLISQSSFREFTRRRTLLDRLERLAMTTVAGRPRYVRRDGRSFKLEHSSGPAPWASDGDWHSHEEILAKLKSALGDGDWYDVHAT